MSGVDGPVYERADVVYGDDPFNGDMAGRPWLVVSNHKNRPFHGEQYIVLALTSRSWLDGLVEIPASAWLRGGVPTESRLVPWGVQSISSGDIAFWQGRLAGTVVDEAVDALVSELRTG